MAGPAGAEEPRRLTTERVDMGDAVVSWDGTTVVFLRHRDGQPGYDLCTVGLDGGAVVNLTRDRSEGLPLEGRHQFTLSPDGRAVLYVDDYDLWRVALTGGPVERLTQDAGATGIHVSPERNAVYFTSYRPLNLAKVKGPIPPDAAGVLMIKLFQVDLETKKETMLDWDLVGDDDQVFPGPDGAMVVIGSYYSDGGRFDDRAVALLDPAGNRTRTKLAAPLSFRPAFLDGGNVLVVVDQLLKGGKPVPCLVGWNRAKDRTDEMDVPLAPGHEPGTLWPVPGFRSMLMTAGSRADGWDVYRYDPEARVFARLTEKRFTGAWGGGVTPDGKRLVFLAALPGEEGTDLWVLDPGGDP